MKKFLIIFVFILSISDLSSKVLATIGQETISSQDVKRTMSLMEENNPAAAGLLNKDDALEQLINLKVALIDAKAKGIDKTEKAKEAMEGALVNYYVYSNVDLKYRNKRFSKKEVNYYYKQNPVIKFQRLAIRFNPKSKDGLEKANSKLSVLRSDIVAKKMTFKQATKSLGEEVFAEISGTFDRVPLVGLPSHEASNVRGLARGVVSSIMIGKNTVSIIKILNIYPMSREYGKTINEILRRQEIIQARKDFFNALRAKYSAAINVKN